MIASHCWPPRSLRPIRCSPLAWPMTGSTAERRRSSRLICSVTRRFASSGLARHHSEGDPSADSNVSFHPLALQLQSLFDVHFSSDGLMGASPNGPCNDVGGVDPSSRKADGDAADFLDRPADQWWGGLAPLASLSCVLFLGAAWRSHDDGLRPSWRRRA